MVYKKLLKSWRSLLGMGASVAVPWLADYTFRKVYEESAAEHELHYPTTSDGVTLALWRYLNQKDTPGEPVLLVHGLGANHRNLALNYENGIAQYLTKHGYDCWAIDLRGHGKSETPSKSWSFDDYVKRDLPATINYILKNTGYSKLHWVGHSMGGMLYYAVGGALNYQNRLASGTTLASPFGMQEPLSVNRIAVLLNRCLTSMQSLPVLGNFFTELENLPDNVRNLPIPIHKFPQAYFGRWASLLFLQFRDYLPDDLILAYLNPELVDDETIRTGVNVILDKVSYRELIQFADWVINDRWTDETHTIDYADGVSNLSVPSLLFAGAADRMTPPHHLKWGFNQIPVDDKKFVLAGTHNDFDYDYAHVDLVVGKSARREIFPIILDWLKKHPAGAR